MRFVFTYRVRYVFANVTTPEATTVKENFCLNHFDLRVNVVVGPPSLVLFGLVSPPAPSVMSVASSCFNTGEISADEVSSEVASGIMA